MTKYELGEILLSGTKRWNQWRTEHPDATIDFEAMYFSKANLEGANLQGAILEGANLQGANLEGANLQGANLEGANLIETNLEGANLIEAHLEGANLELARLPVANLQGAILEGAILKVANLEGANLIEANFKWAYLGGANLEGANLIEANLENANLTQAYLVEANLDLTSFIEADLAHARFSSKIQIENLASPFSNIQYAQAIFLDEKLDNETKEKLKEPQDRLICTLNITSITPTNLGFFLAGIEACYNNFFYLTTTGDTDYDLIIDKISHPYFRDMEAKNQLQISKIEPGSIKIAFYSLVEWGGEILENLLKPINQITKTLIDVEEIKNKKLDGKMKDLEYQQKMMEFGKEAAHMSPEELEMTQLIAEHMDDNKMVSLLENMKNAVVAKHSKKLTDRAMRPALFILTKLYFQGGTLDSSFKKKDDPE